MASRPVHCRAAIGSGGCMTAAAPAVSGEKRQTHDLWFEPERHATIFLSGITPADVIFGRVSARAIGLAGTEDH